LGRDRRIGKSSEFGEILSAGRRASTPLVNVALMPARGRGRIGISASTRVGGSVQRNRARRLVREYYRQTHRNSSPYDIVFNLKPGFADLSAEQVKKVLDEAFSKAIGGRRSGRPSDPGH